MFVKAASVDRKWGMRDNLRCGLYEMVAPAGYVALAGMWKRDESASVDVFGQARCFHQSLVMEAEWGGRLWEDKRSHAEEDGSVWPVVPKEADESIEVMAKWPDSQSKQQVFHGVTGHDGPSGPVYLPNLSKMAVLSGVWLADISL